MKNKHTSVTQNQSHFASAVHADVQRSKLLRNSTKKTTFNAGDLVPVYVDEILPGDTFEMDMAFVSRMSTPIFPTMDVLNLDFYAFFVPNRIIWSGWEELNGENKTSAWTPTIPPALVPQFTTGTIQSKQLGDYMGLPVGMNLAQHGVNCMPFRGYALIWNEWFRDQNLQAPIPLDIGNTQDNNATNVRYTPHSPLLRTNKKHDYFTSCLPAPQKGASALIPIELNELMPVVTGLARPHVGDNKSSINFRTSSGGLISDCLMGIQFNSSCRTGDTITGVTEGIYPINLWADGTGINISASTVSELRTAFQIQKLFERDARGGTRYVEMLKAHFGVDAQDYRLQRPEFLGKHHSYVGIQQVPQMSSTDTTSPQGNMAAFSYTAGRSVLFKKSFVEHGFLFICAVARQPKTYQQGLERMFSRRERLDYYLPVLSHISEQPVLSKEIYALGNNADGNLVFGYNEAWADYRYKPNQVTGQFRSNVPNSLDNWHYADFYNSRPILSDTWIQENSQTNIDRTIAVTSSLHDQIIIDIAFRCDATRPMPVHSIPGFVDHF
jgi:hypothetical protein